VAKVILVIIHLSVS